MNPLVTVIMPVYNCEEYLKESIESILNQSFSNFVFFIIDDGSTDKSGEIIDFYAETDSRIRVVHQANMGLISTLNRAIRVVETKYIARMDGDDVSHSERLQRQIEFLEGNADVGIVGTGISYRDVTLSNAIYETYFPENPLLTLWIMGFRTGIGHATIVMRTNLFELIGPYSEDAKYVEDYDFFIRASKVTKLASLQSILYIYRNHAQSVSNVFREEQKKRHFDLSMSVLKLYVPDVDDDCVSFMKYAQVANMNSYPKVIDFMFVLYSNFCRIHRVHSTEKKAIKNDVARKLFTASVMFMKVNFFMGLIKLFRVILFNYRILLLTLSTRINVKK